MNKKKFLFVMPSLVGGGSERVLVTIANNLCVENKIEILTLVNSDAFYSIDKRVEIHSLELNVNRRNTVKKYVSLFKGFFISLFHLKEEIKKCNPDAVLSFSKETNVFVIVLKLLGSLKCKLVVSERANPYYRNAAFQLFEKLFYSFADLIICQSVAASRFFGAKNSKKIEVIRNPLNENSVPSVFHEVRVKKIVAVGRLFPEKNHALLIDAFCNLDPIFDDYILEIYGEGPLRKNLEQKIKSSKKQDKIFLMGEKRNVMHLIADAALFVLPSESEGFPNVLIEALASGLPVVSTNFAPNGVAGEIVDEKNGIVVPCNNVSAMVDAIENMLTDKNIISYMKDERERIKKIYDEKIVTQEFYKALL